jgi:predicted oxidoreductase
MMRFAAGKIRTLAVSNFTLHQTAALNHFLGHKLVATQPEISPLRIDCFENGTLDQAMMLGLTPFAWSPLGGGRLASPEAPRDKAVAAELDRRCRRARVFRAASRPIRWLMAHPAGIVPIIGSQQAERIAEGAARTERALEPAGLVRRIGRRKRSPHAMTQATTAMRNRLVFGAVRR